jgi:hypothetical protein
MRRRSLNIFFFVVFYCGASGSADLPVSLNRGEKGERENRSADLPVSIDRGEKGERKNRSADLPVSIYRGEKGRIEQQIYLLV